MKSFDCSEALLDVGAYEVPSVHQRLHARWGPIGRGVTMAFLDSGFYPHPDLGDRIVAYHDTSGETSDLLAERCRKPCNWHGMMTSVVACGDGSLSDGRYKGLASGARLVLVKCSRGGRIVDDLILSGLCWIKEHIEEYGINIVNISVGSDYDPRALNCEISQEAEAIAGKGVLVMAAAGNDGGLPRPPANAPSVLTVGGYVSRETCSPEEVELYSSNFGVILDLVVKPEVIAPAAWVAAPVLPGTDQFRRNQYYYDLASAKGGQMLHLLNEVPRAAVMPRGYRRFERQQLAEYLRGVFEREKIVGRHYQHVDGTSFASPIVASIAAQLLEVNPLLSPAAVRQILMSTADRVQKQNLLAQGCGMVNACRAVEQAGDAWTPTQICELRPPLVENGRLSFVFVNYEAKKVELMGDFNDWTPHRHLFTEEFGGLWKVDIAAPKEGTYRYKFRINEETWLEDPANLYRKPNVFGTYDSILSVT